MSVRAKFPESLFLTTFVSMQRFKRLALPILLLWMLAFCGYSQTITNLGIVTVDSALTWTPSPTATGYHVYVENGTNWVRFQVATNQWPGIASTNISGSRRVFVTAFNKVGESVPSYTVMVTFRSGVPIAPGNIQIFTVVRAMATNNLVPMPPLMPVQP